MTLIALRPRPLPRRDATGRDQIALGVGSAREALGSIVGPESRRRPVPARPGEAEHAWKDGDAWRRGVGDQAIGDAKTPRPEHPSSERRVSGGPRPLSAPGAAEVPRGPRCRRGATLIRRPPPPRRVDHEAPRRGGPAGREGAIPRRSDPGRFYPNFTATGWTARGGAMQRAPQANWARAPRAAPNSERRKP
jgi:hypothetical protein